jgi:hypothetical protein
LKLLKFAAKPLKFWGLAVAAEGGEGKPPIRRLARLRGLAAFSKNCQRTGKNIGSN